MKKPNGNYSERSNPSGGYSGAETLHRAAESTSTSKRRQRKRQDPAVVYEEGDLRGIVAGALATSTDPYLVLLEAGVIKNAAEFFDSND